MGHASIFVSVASYRDRLCRESIADALTEAAYPERLRFGVVDQTTGDAVSCTL